MLINKNNYTKIILLLFFLNILFNNCEGEQNNKNKSKQDLDLDKINSKVEDQYNDGCIDYIALWSASDISKTIGKSKKWVFLNYKVDIFDIKPSLVDAKVVGSLRASSYAKLLDADINNYLVESPVGNVRGWVNKEHVKSIVRKNPKTRALCE
tara:strand:+ start:1432 stop:1890 length:459 start_codon:yes stop_codon:yes gene_type:complete